MSASDNDDTLHATLHATRIVAGAATEAVTEAATQAAAGGPAQLHEAPSDSELRAGDIISERYELVKLLGEGGMGRVFLATDQLYAREFEDRQSQVAIKFLGARFAAHSVARMALQRETRKSQQLSHPNVVRVLHFDQHQGLPYMIMEFMRGQPLDEFLERECQNGLSLKLAMPLIEGMANGLDYIHGQGLIHSDFKPNNVFVGDDGSAKILDLGIARAREDALEGQEQTRFNASDLGAMTPSYASCEMFEGLAPDPRDDVYALACVTYELLKGHHPFNRQPAIRARSEGRKPEPPPGLDKTRWRALRRGLAFARKDRTPSARELLAGLRGEGRRREKVALALGSTAIVAGAVAWMAGSYLSGPSPDAVFLDGLTPSPPPTVTAQEAQQLEGWLDQGRTYLDIAKQEYAGGDLVTALHIMDGGADNAYRAFSSVLKKQRSEPARQGVLDMLATYAAWAEDSAANGRLDSALLITCHGLKIHPGSPVLQQLGESYREDLPPDRVAQLMEC